MNCIILFYPDLANTFRLRMDPVFREDRLSMKKNLIIFLLFLLLVPFSACSDRGYGGYQSGDYLARQYSGPFAVVCTKSITVRDQPSYNGRKVTTASNGDFLTVVDRSGDWTCILCQKDGKEYTGWVLTRYIVIQPMTITLLSSNIPAYCAPDRSSKQVGSLARQTELTVLGTWGDFYIVSLRNASAFIAMDADLITSDELYLSLYTASGVARTLRNTQMHSGPGDDWKTVATVPAGTEIHCGTLRDDWLLVLYNGIPGFVPFEDVQIVRTDDGNG